MTAVHADAGSRRLVMIAFDAAEITMIEAGIAAGWLPTLRRLRERGAMVRLRSDASVMVGTVWPSFYGGLLPPEHGIFGVVQWRPETMRHERIDDQEWLPTTPFYRTLGAEGPRVLAIDMPFAPTPRPFNGLELVSWNAHARRAPRSGWPADLPGRVRRAHGRPVTRDEIYGPQRPRALLRLRDELIAAVRQQGRIVADLARSEPWQLLLTGIGAAHRGGHKLPSTAGASGGLSEVEHAALEAALTDVYIACDTVIGEILAAAGENTTAIVFTLNGMEANTSHYFLLPEMLRRVLEDDRSDRTAEPPPAPGLVERLRQAVPLELRNRVKEQLPLALKDALGLYWRRAEERDWSAVRAFRLIGSDLEGQVQINLKGRERDGVVAPGAEYEALCEKIVDGLTSFADADTGEPVVAEVIRTAALWPEARVRHVLPDLVIRWAGRSPLGLRALRSPRYGGFANLHPETLPDGRCGHHQPVGWALGVGPGIAPGGTQHELPVFDLTATVYAHFGLRPPAEMRGRPISELLAGAGVHA